jgi:hypothetical protein
MGKLALMSHNIYLSIGRFGDSTNGRLYDNSHIVWVFWRRIKQVDDNNNI